MKRVFIVGAIASVMVACNQNPKTQPSTTITTDTTGLAQYQAWKAQNELQNTTAYNPNQTANTQPTTKVIHVYEQPRRSTSTRSRSYSSNNGSMTSTSSNTATAKKKGWSKAAKGAVIGGVTGGVIGAVVNKKNRVVGGVIGAVIGGGGGYVIGRKMDKKDGRY